MGTLIIIYKDANINLIEQSIDSLIDNTNIEELDNILILSHLIPKKSYPKISIKNYEGICQVNSLIQESCSESITIINGPTKFNANWFSDTIERLSDDVISSPKLYDLDEDLFASKGEIQSNFTFDSLLNIKDNKRNSSVLSPYYISIKSNRIKDLGLFEEGFVEISTAIIELSIRHMLSGGKISIADSVLAIKRNDDFSKLDRLRISDSYFEKRSHYFAYFNPEKRHTRVDKLVNHNVLRKVDVDSYFINHLPELAYIYKLFSVANHKHIAVIGTGPSIDNIPKSIINSFDILIGVDYAPILFDVDLILTDRTNVVNDLREEFNPRKFVLPIELKDMVNGGSIHSKEVISHTYLFEYSKVSVLPNEVCPPFINFNDSVLTAVHLSLFMLPKSITVFGFDNKLIEGRSHTNKIEYYDDGKILTNSSATFKLFEYLEYGFKHLSKLAVKHNIPLLRYNHV